jgi:hypothetical protein
MMGRLWRSEPVYVFNSSSMFLGLINLLKQYSMVTLVILHLLYAINDKRTSWPLF